MPLHRYRGRLELKGTVIGAGASMASLADRLPTEPVDPDLPGHVMTRFRGAHLFLTASRQDSRVLGEVAIPFGD